MFSMYGLLFMLCLALAPGGGSPKPPTTPGTNKPQFPRNYLPSGEQMFKDYCSACHGEDGKGRGPVSAYLTKQPSDLTTLSKNRGGTFPEQYVATILSFGPGLRVHRTSEMPVWGPTFQQLDNYNEAAVQHRIQRLCEYLESIQEN